MTIRSVKIAVLLLLACLVASASAQLGEPTVARDAITRKECTEQGGTVVGDIGNVAIFQLGYVCENSGAASTYAVVAGPGEPIASDGEVCCGGDAEEGGDAMVEEEETSDGSTVTREECMEQGGTIVGDIGNGAIFRPGYVCETSGAAPTHRVVAGPGEPIAREGEVCCGGDGMEEKEEETIVVSVVTRDECTMNGGTVVGDIGNGAIFRPGYVCDNSGAAPTHRVVAGLGEPIASEGEVCCGGDGIEDEEETSGMKDEEETTDESSSIRTDISVMIRSLIVVLGWMTFA